MCPGSREVGKRKACEHWNETKLRRRAKRGLSLVRVGINCMCDRTDRGQRWRGHRCGVSGLDTWRLYAILILSSHQPSLTVLGCLLLLLLLMLHLHLRIIFCHGIRIRVAIVGIHGEGDSSLRRVWKCC